MSSGSQYRWAEENLQLPPGASRMELSGPVNCKIYEMYLGTTSSNADMILSSGFRQFSDGMLGRGVYLSRSLEKASRYPIGHPEYDRVVIKVLLKVGKAEAIYHAAPLQKTWHDLSYDTWVAPRGCMVRTDLEDCVLGPASIQLIGTIRPQPINGPICSCGCEVLSAGTGRTTRTNTDLHTADETPSHTDSIMNLGGLIQWAEEDFQLPPGTLRMELSGPVNGQTYVMYHGTTRSNADQILNNGFRQSSDGMLGRGVYLSRDLEKASRYPLRHPEYDRVVITVVVNVGKVKRIDYQKHPLQKTWHDHGYDTAWVPPRCGMVPSGLEENCVWDPARIRIIRTIQPKPAPNIQDRPDCACS
ncbi:uncharacterized protein LOC115386924 [Salarias fasciatus]|uniref:uncharacterized protein LOC115386924 n=1 Tax=Salarias fasciatus TaxID=181472 RepID=UPI001176AD14|nr:uncharacterized protein LOC115386924 [Salarias fasciatus]